MGISFAKEETGQPEDTKVMNISGRDDIIGCKPTHSQPVFAKSLNCQEKVSQQLFAISPVSLFFKLGQFFLFFFYFCKRPWIEVLKEHTHMNS